MVCYNHNPQGVSFESCATRFLCSDAPEPPEHRRQSVGTGRELAQDELAQHMVGGWIIQMAQPWTAIRKRIQISIAIQLGERAKSSCFFIGFAN